MLSLDQRSPHSSQSDQTSHSTIKTIGCPRSPNQGLGALFSQIRGDNVQTDCREPELYYFSHLDVSHTLWCFYRNNLNVLWFHWHFFFFKSYIRRSCPSFSFPSFLKTARHTETSCGLAVFLCYRIFLPILSLPTETDIIISNLV